MKKILFIVLSIFTWNTYGQNKYNYVQFNRLTEIIGTEYMIASVDNFSKISVNKSKYLLFINTASGETRQVDLPHDAGIGKLEQIKIDSLSINILLLSVRTIDLDGKNGIDWNDPTQIILLSTDGKEKISLTEEKFFVRNWAINKLTGRLVVTGHYDTNNNNKYDKEDKNKIHIYDLSTFKLINKI